MTPRRLFAVIPAAGHSRRMGTHKLLLSLGKETVIQRLIRGLGISRICRIIIVARRADQSFAAHLAGEDVELVQPEVDPPDMKASVQAALRWIEAHYHPTEEDSWLLIPADHPVLKPDLIERLCEVWSQSAARIMIPTFEGQKGHPAFFRWSVAKEVFQLGAEQGINALWKEGTASPMLWECEDPEILIDLDTPTDLEAVRQRFAPDFE
ncbi:nucleotidyltransferase family protein [Gimesia panareensis]|uniref:Molybdenum cofactor cytidylyltransferase n=1 Tax=Gimesia panareensis TaxID=2527978 RepID=A0A517QAF0_9PLAN|nr:nucleotidyltransferase family protein [Gimesia panareensis]QDT28607.1 Molybdenum cofactor cytidylyltransferase [Gimesia panareensis]QDU51466.1 Molybdenum cofactor cytidylyltransferase [Gimesia panareensis]